MQGAHLRVAILGAITTGIVYAISDISYIPCQSDRECAFNDSYCSREFEMCAYHRCRCLAGFDADESGVCSKRLYHGMQCTHNSFVCFDLNNECNEEISTCQCKENFELDRNSSNNNCRPSNYAVIGEECDTIEDCYVDTSVPSSVECVVNDGTRSPKYCRCKSGYKELTDEYGCELPTLGEACVTEVGCYPVLAHRRDPGFKSSLDCTDNTCQCSDGYYEIMHPIEYHKSFRKMCISNYTGELKDNGDSCTQSAHCESKMCIRCNNYKFGVCAVIKPKSHADRKWPAGSLLVTMLLVLKALW